MKQLALVDASQRRLNEFHSQLSSECKAVDVIPIRCNVADEASVVDMVKNTVSTFGRIDYAVNAAGLAHVSRFADFKTSDVSRRALYALTTVGQGYWYQRKGAVLLHEGATRPNGQTGLEGGVSEPASRSLWADPRT